MNTESEQFVTEHGLTVTRRRRLAMVDHNETAVVEDVTIECLPEPALPEPRPASLTA